MTLSVGGIGYNKPATAVKFQSVAPQQRFAGIQQQADQGPAKSINSQAKKQLFDGGLFSLPAIIAVGAACCCAVPMVAIAGISFLAYKGVKGAASMLNPMNWFSAAAK